MDSYWTKMASRRTSMPPGRQARTIPNIDGAQALIIERLPARSGSFKIPPECNSFVASSMDHKAAHQEHSERPETLKQQEASTNKENLEPNDDGRRQVAESNQKLEAKRIIKTMTLRRRRRRRQASTRSRVRGNKFAILDNDMSLPNVLYAISIIAMMLACTATRASSYLTPAPTSSSSSSSSTSTSAPLSLLSSPLSSSLGRDNSRSPALTFPSSTLDWRRIGTSLMRQLERLPFRSPAGGSQSTESSSSVIRFPLRQANPITRLMNRVRQQIGARNTIRVHNAFRDFAWRILSSLSMPTPVIYELRRQNFYSADEDVANDNFYNRNTSKTIRSKRLFDLVPSKLPGSINRRTSKSDDDDDDSEPESLRERLRTRFEDMMSLSRRSLFGRVARLPSLFPFKRQEEEDGDDRTDGATTKQSASSSTTSRRPRLTALASRRKRRRELDRQIIEINGKQFYVDDDGELKELKESQE